MLNPDDIMEFCRECGRMVIITQKSHMDYVEWICSECGATVDSYCDDFYDYGDMEKDHEMW